MDIPDFNVTLLCLFCRAPLQGPEDAEYSSGDLIKCTKCNEENDYDSVLEVAKEKGISEVTKAVEDQLNKTIKKLFKGF